MINIPTLIGAGIIGSSAGRATRVRASQRKGLWYWLAVAPVKWTVILVFGLVVGMLLLSFGIIVAIPWVIVRAIQKKPLLPMMIKG